MANPRAYARRRASYYGLDPNAVLAVAQTEGGWGGAVGDSGTSYGPWQLHWNGAMPKQYWGNAEASKQFAYSNEGIDYALSRMAQAGARNKTGRAAIEAIVRGFERPADPASEIQKALGFYGNQPPAQVQAAQPQIQGAAQDAGSDRRRALLGYLLDMDPTALPPLGKQATPGPLIVEHVRKARAIKNGGFKGSLAEAFYDPIGGYDRQGKKLVPTGPIGGHSDHVHLSISNKNAMIAAIRKAQSMGLAARENPFVDQVDPVHTKGSFHYRTFPGSKVGMGVDVSGDPKKMAAFYRWAVRQLG